MRTLRSALLPLLLLSLSACATEMTHGEATRTPAAAADPGASEDDAERVPPEAEGYAVPQLALDAPTTAHARFVVNGFLDSDAQAIFRLRTDLGCPNDATLTATRSGVAFAIPLDVAQLTEVFACAVHVDAQSESELPPSSGQQQQAPPLLQQQQLDQPVLGGAQQATSDQVRATVLARLCLGESRLRLLGWAASADPT